MRFLYAAVAALGAAVASAQTLNNAISIPEGSSTLDVTAGQPLTIEWTNPSDGTVTIKLQQVPITPEGGITLASGIPASALTATLQIPAADDVNTFQYTIEIIDDTNTDNINFSPNFGIQGATGTALATTATGSATSSPTGSTTITSSSTGTESTTTTTSGDESTSTEDSTSTDSSSPTTTVDSSSTTSVVEPTETTSAPDSGDNGAAGVKVQGGLLAMAVGLIAVL